jgi:hypothetical protein
MMWIVLCHSGELTAVSSPRLLFKPGIPDSPSLCDNDIYQATRDSQCHDVSTRDTRSIYQATRDSQCSDVSTRDAQCLLRLLIPELNTLPIMHMFGYVIVDEETYIFEKALFDTGSNRANLISQQYVDKYSSVFEPYIVKSDSEVRLGDSTTVVHITHLVTLRVSFLDNNAITHVAILNFNIMPISHLDMIIGVNSILFSFFDLFIDMVKVARKSLFNNTSDPTSSKLLLLHDIPTHPD